MIRSLLKQTSLLVALLVFLAACLFLDTTPVRLSRLFGPVAAEILATFHDPGTQWMVYACCAVYFVTFTLLGKRGMRSAERGAPGSTPHPQSLSPVGAERNAEGARACNLQPATCNLLSPDLWLCGLAVWVTLRYAFDYDTASSNTHALALMAGMAIGQGVRAWAQWRKTEGNLLRQGYGGQGVQSAEGQVAKGLEAEHRTLNVAQCVPPVGEAAGKPPTSSKEQAAAGTGEHSTLNAQPSTSKVAQCVPPVPTPKAPTPSPISDLPTPNAATLILSCLLLLLAGAAFWQPEAGTIFQYRGQARWQGPWDNPNIYGLLMGVGLVLAVGLLVERLRIVAQASRLLGTTTECSRDACATLGRTLWTLLLIAAAALCGYGLIKSYSRGAWMGTALALAYLLWRAAGMRSPVRRNSGEGGTASQSVPRGLCAPSEGSPDKPRSSGRESALASWCSYCPSWLTRNRFPWFVLFLSLFVLAFWQFRHTEQPLVRRVFTVGNPNDFSWRNRIAAWEGALAMMAENPVNGVGWSRPESLYDHYYRPVKVDEGMAIQLNHYFIVGMSAGLPALIFFVGYVGLCLLRRNVLPSVPPADPINAGNREDRSVYCQRDAGQHANPASLIYAPSSSATACRAGAIVLLVGLWFDGGLFNLATAAPLWLLLGLGGVAKVAQASGIESVGMRFTASQTSPARRRTRWNASLPIFGWATCRFWVVTFLLSALLLTALLWAHARDPFRRADFTVRAPGVPPARAMAVMPKGDGPFPVVLWAHGSGGDLLRSGDELRQIAELGVAAVGFDYDKTNQANFDAQMQALLQFISNQVWADAKASGWIANSLGAQRTLSFALRHPEQAPEVMVRLNGGTVSEISEVRSAKSEVAEGEHSTLNLQPAISNVGQRVPPVGEQDFEPATFNQQPATQIWLIHGENDEVFPAADVRQLAEELEAQGVSVRLNLFPGRGRGFGPDQPLLVRAAAEWCAKELGAGPPVPVNVRPGLMWYGAPLGFLSVALCGFALARKWNAFRHGDHLGGVGPGAIDGIMECGGKQRATPLSEVQEVSGSLASHRKAVSPPASAGSATAVHKEGRPMEADVSHWFARMAAIVAGLAILDTVLHLAPPLLPATPRTVNWAERFVVRPELKQSFRWLAAQLEGRDVFHRVPKISSSHDGDAVERIPTTSHRDDPPQLRTLLAHVELATLQRQLADWPVTEDLWREWVLSPSIGGVGNDIRWRRMLWEHFYPRVRRESNSAAAAEIVARQLALRVAVQDGSPSGKTIREMWIEGAAVQEGFEHLYVAALRSVGVPARIAGDGRCEFHDGAAWRESPRPFSESLMAKRAEEGTGTGP